MKQKGVSYAFIDGQNLNLGIGHDVTNKRGRIVYHGQKLDWRKFRTYLREKYGVTQAYIFIGLVPTNNSLYTYLQRAGFTIIFKEVSYYIDDAGQTIVKGNVDTDIVLYAAAKLADEYDTAVFVSGDGDFTSLYDYVDSQGKLGNILVPNRHRYSKLLNRFRSKIRFVSDLTPLFKQRSEPQKKTRSGVRSATLDLPGHGDTPKIVAKKPKNIKTPTGKARGK